MSRGEAQIFSPERGRKKAAHGRRSPAAHRIESKSASAVRRYVGSMKATGYVRKLDHLGRFVIPGSVRRSLEFTDHQPLLIAVDGDRIILEKETPRCAVCGERATEDFAGKHLCVECLAGIGRL